MNTVLCRLVLLFNFLIVFPCCTYRYSRPTPSGLPSALSPHIRDVLEGKHTPHALRGIAKVRVESPDKKFSVREVVVIQRPHYLRMETLSPLGQPEFFVVTDGHELSFFSPSENRYYYGRASPENIARLISAELGVEEIVSLMMGSMVLKEYDRERIEYKVKGKVGVVKLFSLENEEVQTLTLDLSSQRVIEFTQIAGGRKLRARYSNYLEIEGKFFPREIEIVVVTRDKTKVRVNYQEMELLTEMDPFTFRLIPPSGVELIPLD